MHERKDEILLGSKIAAKIMSVPARAIVHLCLDVFVVKEVQDVPRCFFNKNQARQDLQIHPIRITDS